MTSPHDSTHARRWLILLILGLGQLMVILDATVVNIALPSAQRALHFSAADRQWIVTAYTLAFGGLLLPAGRIADLVGRKVTFIAGLVGFASASALGGASGSLAMLIGARALQGLFAAFLAPSALALVSATFTDADERRRAFGIFGAIGVGGGAVGLLLGGVLTAYASWRWCLYVNVPIAASGAIALLRDPRRAAAPSLDIPGTITAFVGLVALVYGVSQAGTHGWSGTSTLGFIGLGVALLAVFVAIEQRVARPLLPLRIVLDRTRGGALLALGVDSAGLLSVFLFLTYYLQQNLGLSPVMTGLAFLPAPVATAIGATQGSTRLANRFDARRVIPVGMALAAAGLVWLAQLGPHSPYATGVLPSLVVMSFGLGCVTGLAMGVATFGADPADTGVASAAVNTMQQIGGSLGTALLSTVAVSAAASLLATGRHTPQVLARASAHGYTSALWCSAALIAAGSIVSARLLRMQSRPLAQSDDANAAEPATAG